MDNFIEKSIDYLFNKGSFNFTSGYQKFEFRIRPSGNIEVTEIIDKQRIVYDKEEIYPFFAYLVFCDIYSTLQKSTISLNKDRNVSYHNLKALNKVYDIYQTMLTIDGPEFALIFSDDDPTALENVLLQRIKDYLPVKQSQFKYEVIKNRIDTIMHDFARKYGYFDTVWNILDTTEEYELLHEYAYLKWQDLNNYRVVDRKDYFTKQDALEALYSLINRLEKELELHIKGDLLIRQRIIEALQSLMDYDVDIVDIVYFIKVTFFNVDTLDRCEILINDFIETIETSFLDEEIQDIIINKLRGIVKSKVQKGKILKLR